MYLKLNETYSYNTKYYLLYSNLGVVLTFLEEKYKLLSDIQPKQVFQFYMLRVCENLRG